MDFQMKEASVHQNKGWIIVVLSYVVCVGIGYVDYRTGTEISLSVFYLIPVYLMVWHYNLRQGIIISIVATVLYLLGEHMARNTYSTTAIPYWNAGVRAGFLIVVGYLISKLKDLFLQEQKFAYYDYLTGVANSRALYQKLTEERVRMQRYPHPLTVVYIDLDNFKTINDKSGHNTGDEILKAIANTMRGNLRATDFLARLGGDEFVLLLPETSMDQARVVLDKLQDIIAHSVEQGGLRITMSIGAITFNTGLESNENMIRMADNLMYKAKKKGKNCTVMDMYRMPEEQKRLTQK
jgi:diguanylate cyclase (GGDEF)-like protein